MQILFLLAIMLAPLATICSAQTVSTKTFGTGANQFTIDFVTIGNPNNLADPNASPRPAGAVSYIYRMGKYEVSRDMITKANAEGSLGIPMLSMSSYGGNGLNRPATRITWNGAMAFVNWLNTSTGGTPAYKTDVKGLFQVWTPSDPGYQASNPYRNSLAKYWLPSVDEWHKAAYSSPSGTWYRLATGTDGFYPENPTSILNGTGANTIVYGWGTFTGPADIMNAGGLSPYGTMAQNGNVNELVETAYDGVNDTTGENRSFRGGSWETSGSSIFSVASSSMGWSPSESSPNIGFRVAMAAPANYFITAIFDTGKGNVAISPNKDFYEAGESATLTATSKAGYLFSSWSGVTTSTTGSIVLNMDSDKTVTANFIEDNGDADSDGLTNFQESVTYGTNPNQKDSNGDGVEDGHAVSMGYSPTLSFSALIAHPPTGLYTATQYSANYTAGQQSVISTPNTYNLFTITQYNDHLTTGFNAGKETGKADGRSEVTSNPASYNLYTATQYSDNYSSGQQNVLSSPNTHNLYTTSQILNMAVGDLVLTKQVDGSFVLNYDIEQSTDLQSWLPYQSFNLPLTNLPPDKAFIRFRAKQ